MAPSPSGSPPAPRMYKVSDPVAAPSSDTELLAHVERILSSQYELDREIGRGGMGIVYRAKDRRLKRTVAIKLLPPEFAFRSDIRSRFLREAETAAQLSHPNIVPIYSVDEKDGLVYFVMSCIEGDNLAKVMHDRGRLAPDFTRRIVREVADALAYAHARGVVHRDIKPDNILLDGDGGRALITDFGIARAAEAATRLTATGMAIGTPAYMAPEQAAGDREVDGRTDLYSLGVVAYQMLAGELPFAATSTAAMLVKHISERPTPLEQRRADVPTDLSRAVMMLLEKDPGDRFPSAASLSVALETGNVPAARVPTGMNAAQGLIQATSASIGGMRPGLSIDLQVNPSFVPSSDEMVRWNAQPVIEFRRKLAPYLVTSFVLVLLQIFTTVDLMFVAALWTVYIAFRYAKLWAQGYDWRDVFKQHKDRLLVDVVAETCDDAVAMFDPKRREELRARRRRDANSPSGLRAIFESNRDGGVTAPAPVPALPAPLDASMAGPYAGVVRQAGDDRAELLRLFGELPKSTRDGLPDVVTSANELAERIQALAVSLTELDRADAEATRTLATIDAEIQTLEAQANPFEGRASDARVVRLKDLRRQRRAVVDVHKRREQSASRLETCRLALQNMRYEVLRLKTGTQTQGNVTTLAEQALVLARDVDAVVYAREEMDRFDARRGGTGAGAAGGA